MELNRSNIECVNTALYTHWHPDHTAGVRVFEGNYPLDSLLDPGLPPRQTRVILPERVARTFAEHHALGAKLSFLEKFGLVRVEEVEELQKIDVEGWAVTPVPLAEEFAVAYLFESERRVFICADESYGFEGVGLGPLDLAILPCGYFSHHPYNGDRIIADGHPVLHREIAYEETLDLIRRLDADRVVLVHLNHGLGLLPSEFSRLAADLQHDGTLPIIEFAYDTMVVTV